MDFNLFSKQVSKIKNLPLPGVEAHYKMVPAFRQELMKKNTELKKIPKKAGVMALFYPDAQNNTNFLLILRKTYEGIHSNQIAFPGGKAEKSDTDIMNTALRETEEEVGVPVASIDVLKELTQVYIPPSNFMVSPFIGLATGEISFILQEEEVENIVEVSMLDLLDDKKIFAKKITTSYAVDVDVPAFKLNGYTVWGATAMMLSEVKDLIKQVL
ncbi:CoA pyrophosphatase [Aurantibacter crassamenti]|uniref:NUDIX hydrolase n=1 Tax=Aurantibacter crassamenti TaxID=1837375 RepID=UPI00193ABFD0|nr:CoA pyrophosphatase [Aurantibacter crassamenti]MBM1107888.1 CoA pyrophosphatase [Aurantibacter crassamenti]